MKHVLLHILALMLICPGGRGDGFISFSNRLESAAASWPVMLDLGGGTLVPLYREEYRAQLYAGLTPEDMKPIGPMVGFGTGTNAGYFQAVEAGDHLIRRVPTIDGVPGGTTWVQVRAWAYWPAIATFDDVLKRQRCYSFVPYGASAVVRQETVNNEANARPIQMLGIGGFTVAMPLSPVMDQFQAVRLTPTRMEYRYYANTGGFPGVHELERSADFITWQPMQRFTNDFELIIAITNAPGSWFYRMRRECD